MIWANDPDTRLILSALRQNGMLLEDVREEWQNNEAIVLEAVQQQGLALEHASVEMKNNEEIANAAVQNRGSALEFASDDMKDTTEIAMPAMQESGFSRRHASEQLQHNPMLIGTVFDALRSQGWNGWGMIAEMPNNEDVGRYVFRQDGAWARVRQRGGYEILGIHERAGGDQ